MKTPKLPGLFLAATLFACDSGKQTDTGGEASDEADDESGTDTTDSDSTETSSGGPEDSDGPPTPADFTTLCEQQTDRAGCEAVPGEYYPWEDQTMWCAWWVEVPVELVDGTCTFGEAQARCQAISAPESGCGGDGNGCPSGGAGWSYVEGESVVIGQGDVCNEGGGESCHVDAEGMVLEGAPECACLCDPAFPN